MKEDHNSHTSRIWEFTRPFVNATLALAIILIALVLWLVNSTQSLVEGTLNDVKFSLIEEFDSDAKLLLIEFRKGEAEFKSLRDQLQQLTEQPVHFIDPGIIKDLKELRKDADRISSDLNRIASSHIDLSQQTLEKLAIALVQAYSQIRNCNAKSENNPTKISAAHFG